MNRKAFEMMRTEHLISYIEAKVQRDDLESEALKMAVEVVTERVEEQKVASYRVEISLVIEAYGDGEADHEAGFLREVLERIKGVVRVSKMSWGRKFE